MPVSVIPSSGLRTVVVNVPIVHRVDAKPFKRLHLPVKGGPYVGVVDCHQVIVPEPEALSDETHSHAADPRPTQRESDPRTWRMMTKLRSRRPRMRDTRGIQREIAWSCAAFAW